MEAFVQSDNKLLGGGYQTLHEKMSRFGWTYTTSLEAYRKSAQKRYCLTEYAAGELTSENFLKALDAFDDLAHYQLEPIHDEYNAFKERLVAYAPSWLEQHLNYAEPGNSPSAYLQLSRFFLTKVDRDDNRHLFSPQTYYRTLLSMGATFDAAVGLRWNQTVAQYERTPQLNQFLETEETRKIHTMPDLLTVMSDMVAHSEMYPLWEAKYAIALCMKYD